MTRSTNYASIETLLLWLVLLAIAISQSACSIGYVIDAAINHSSILMRRQPIEVVLQDPTTPPDLNTALRWVTAARNYALKQGLDCGGSFLSYAPLETEAISWVVAAAEPLALEAKTWWFPIVGSVPYKGYFDRADAIKLKEALEREGLETIVRGVTAFSTLGWFDDPVMTPLLRQPPYHIVNTVIHESIHQTTWIPHSVDFNESLAHFLALEETIKFFESPYCFQDCANLKEASVRMRDQEHIYAHSLEQLHQRLLQIFANNAQSTNAKLHAKRSAYAQLVPQNSTIKHQLANTANNAEFLQEYLYHQYFPCFTTIQKKLPPEAPANDFLKETLESWKTLTSHQDCASTSTVNLVIVNSEIVTD